VHALTIALAVFQHEQSTELRRCLRDTNSRVVFEAATPEEWSALLVELEQRKPDALIVNLSRLAESWEASVQAIKAASPSTLVVAMHQSADPETILGAIRAGASEYIYPPFPETLRKALGRLEEERARKASEQGLASKVVGIVSAKGGCGATTIACRLAPALRRLTKKEVLLADLDFSMGLISFLMKRKSPYSVVDALVNAHRLDLDYWKALTATLTPGVELISAPPPQQVREIPEAESLYQILRFVRGYYDWIVLDLGRGLSPVSLNLLEEMDQVLIAVTPEVPSFYQAKRIKETLQVLGLRHGNLRLLLNRAPKGLDMKPADLEEMLGLPVYQTLSEDPRGVEEYFQDLKSLPNRGLLGREIDQLASRLAGIEEEKTQKRFLLFSRS
jgi:pilus assembly protein CpaE